MFSQSKNPLPTEGRTALFGGTLNPVHYGHLRIAEEARELFRLEKVVFIPSFSPPLKSVGIAEAGHRVEMVKLAIDTNPYFVYSDIECRRGGKSYTVDTLEEMKRLRPEEEYLFLLGIDAFLDLPNWFRPERLIELCDFIVINRPPFGEGEIMRSPYIDRFEELNSESGFSVISLRSGRVVYLLRSVPIEISASDIRRRIRENLSIKYLLPESVESYIMSSNIYRRSF
jgi:nicotinate-nucleotide adenylyltransferase